MNNLLSISDSGASDASDLTPYKAFKFYSFSLEKKSLFGFDFISMQSFA